MLALQHLKPSSWRATIRPVWKQICLELPALLARRHLARSKLYSRCIWCGRSTTLSMLLLLFLVGCDCCKGGFLGHLKFQKSRVQVMQLPSIQLAMISYSSTSQELSDSDQFRLLVRTPVPDNKQASTNRKPIWLWWPFDINRRGKTTHSPNKHAGRCDDHFDTRCLQMAIYQRGMHRFFF